MQTLTQVREALDELDAMLSEKGWRTPSCEFNMDQQFWFFVKAKHPLEGGDSVNEYCASDTVEDAFKDARKFIRNLPTAENAAKDDFRKGLAALIDKGKALGIETEFLNPLTEQMRALSENIISGPAE